MSKGMSNAVSPIMKARIIAPTTDGAIIGNVTVRNVFLGVAPEMSAASSIR
jgi:hypothetical protein